MPNRLHAAAVTFETVAVAAATSPGEARIQVCIHRDDFE